MKALMEFDFYGHIIRKDFLCKICFTAAVSAIVSVNRIKLLG